MASQLIGTTETGWFNPGVTALRWLRPNTGNKPRAGVGLDELLALNTRN